MEIVNGNNKFVPGVAFYKKESWTSSIVRKIKRHKWFCMVVLATGIFSVINLVMIWNFFRILESL